MNSLKLKNKSILLFLVLPGLFVSDILYGLMEYYNVRPPITPGVLLRGLLLLIAFSWLALNFRKIEKGEAKWLGLLLILTTPGLLIGFLSGSSASYDINTLAKILYLPIVCTLFVYWFNRSNIASDEVFRSIETSAYFLGISLLISQILGIKTETYGSYAFGNTGVFYAQNDLTLAFGLSLLAASYRLTFVEFSLVRLALLIGSLFACLQIGTTAALAIPIIIVCVLFAVYVKGEARRSLSASLIKLVAFFIASCALIYLFNSTLNIYLSHDYQAKKIEALLGGESARAPLTYAAQQHIHQRSYFFDMFGEGFDSFHRGVANYFRGRDARRIVESDPYDIFGAHGIFFLIAIYCYLIRLFYKSIKRIFSSKNPASYTIISSAIFLYIFYSVLVGHALTSPIPSTLLAAYLASFYVAEKGKRVA